MVQFEPVGISDTLPVSGLVERLPGKIDGFYNPEASKCG